jgi:hypothetical protein
VDHSRPPAGSDISVIQQNSAEITPMIADPLNAGGQGNSSEASHNNANFTISTGVNIVDENNLEWIDNSNNFPCSPYQLDMSFLNATNKGQVSWESQIEPGLSLESIGWAAQNNNPISGNLDDFFILGSEHLLQR